MRTPLDDLLCRRYPALYVDRHADMSATAMCWGFCHGDGWFAIIDALSEVLTSGAEIDERPVQPIRQVKEKFGTLRCYWGSTEADDGAVDMAVEMSGRLCEETGRPGRLTYRARRYATRVPGVDPEAQVVGIGPDEDGRMGVPPMDFSLADVMGWRSDVLHGSVEVVNGRLDLVDGMLSRLAADNRLLTERPGTRNVLVSPYRAYTSDLPVRVIRVTRVWETADGLRVSYTGGGRRAEGIVSLALALARRMDRMTGAAGPVDDNGILIRGDG